MMVGHRKCGEQRIKRGRLIVRVGLSEVGPRDERRQERQQQKCDGQKQ